MNAEERRQLVQQYESGPAELRAALQGVPAERLDQPVAEGEWSPRQIAHHCADSELTSAVRLRRLVAEDSPEIIGYDQDLFNTKLHAQERPIETSLAAVDAARASCASLLACLTEDEWQRGGTHSELGQYTVETWLRVYADHCRAHAAQIRGE